jgi:hypothetical protein
MVAGLEPGVSQPLPRAIPARQWEYLLSMSLSSSWQPPTNFSFSNKIFLIRDVHSRVALTKYIESSGGILIKTCKVYKRSTYHKPSVSFVEREDHRSSPFQRAAQCRAWTSHWCTYCVLYRGSILSMQQASGPERGIVGSSHQRI